MDKPKTHDQNKRLTMSPIRLGALIQIARMRPLELDASQDVPISLAEALNYANQNSLDIRIARESYKYQQAQLLGQLADFIPSFALGYTVTKSHVLDPETHSISHVFAPRLIYPLFVGGNNVYGALVQMYRTRGWKYSNQTTLNDTLLNVYKAYTNLALNHALLKIRIKAVEVDEAQLQVNNELFQNGTGTRYDIVQSRSQLASDKQNLLAQQIATRQAAQSLGYVINMPLSINLVPSEESLTETNIIDDSLTINEALRKTLENRPELRQYEMFRYAADRNVQLAASSLYPQLTISQTNNQAITATHTASSRSSSSSNSNSTAGAGIFGGAFDTNQSNVSLSWSLANMGMASVTNIIANRALAKQALLQADQELQLVRETVRSDFINVKAARQKIDTAAVAVDAAAEALRLAMLRLRVGNGTNLEVIQAENTYIADLYVQAQAIVESNQAQAQLLHDMGVIKPANLIAQE